MPRGLPSIITDELDSTTFGLPIYAARITRTGGAPLLRWAERPLADRIPVAAVLPDTPNLYLRMGESPGATVAADASGHSLAGTYVGSPALGVPGAFSGEAATAVTLDGVTQYITVPDNTLIDGAVPLSLEIWAKPLASGGMLFDKGHTGGFGYFLWIVGTLLEFGIRQSGSNQFLLIAQSTIGAVLPGAWSHIVATLSAAGVAHLYVNGVDVTVPVSTRTITNTTDALHIGSSINPDRFFQGTLQDAAIYPSELSAATVLAHFATGFYETRLMSISGMQFSPDNAGPITLVAANIDGAVTTLDRDVTFRGAFVELLAYLPNVSRFYRVWTGRSDEISELTQESATLTAYPTISIPQVQVPRRTIGLACTNTFGNFVNWNTVRDYEGSECPYQRLSTIGFAATLAAGIDASVTAVTVTWPSTSVTDGAKFQQGDRIKIDNERMLIVAQPADPDVSTFQQVLTVERGAMDTIAAAHSSAVGVFFNNCGFGVADCLRRGMYGNNPVDLYFV